MSARVTLAILLALLVPACSSGAASSSNAPNPASAAAAKRPGFLGAFFRPEGTVPFGVFSAFSKQKAPDPYPSPGAQLFGKTGYCDAQADNGVSISSGYLVDKKKIANLIELGVKWARLPISSNFDDQSHLFGAGRYMFADADSAQCALVRNHIDPVVGLQAGTVQYNDAPGGSGGFSAKEYAAYKTAADFAGWCGAVAAHERKTFTSVTRYSIPGNEVNGDAKTFPGGETQIASYMRACYRAIKTAQPKSIVYGFELNMDKRLDAPSFVDREYALGCRQGTCYDAISEHLYLRYPFPPASTPCTPAPGGDYAVACVAAIRTAARAPALHVLIGETAFLVPSTVPDEATKARATVDMMALFAADPLVDGVNYANVDECDLYPSGYFAGGCLVDSVDTKLPAFAALKALARRAF